MKLVTVAQMLAIEKEADAGGFTYELMMENAGRGLAESVQELQPATEDRKVLGLVGPGNNGGDTLVALGLLATSGWECSAYLVKRHSDSLTDRLLKAGGQIMTDGTDDDFGGLTAWLGACTVLLDGLLGTGSRPPLRGEIQVVLKKVNGLLDEMATTPFVVAVDCPSGIDCDSGEASEDSIPADLTVTMAAVKQGLVSMPAFELAGDLRVVDIGLPSDLPSLQAITAEVAEEDLVSRLLPDRPPLAHKGTFGTALIAAGSVNYTGAAYLAAKAAYRIGSGLVTLAVPTPLHAALAGTLPEVTWVLLPHEVGVISRDAADVLRSSLETCDSLLIGPGLGTEPTTREFIARLVGVFGTQGERGRRMGFAGAAKAGGAPRSDRHPTLVVDADGLKLLAESEGWYRLLSETAVLTPHPGEMAILTGMTKEQIQNDRTAVASRFAREWGHVVVLKGAFTVVAAPDGATTLIPVASSALARAGTGDVLAGLIVGLRAQGVGAYESAIAGAWIHAQAGLYASRALGNSASVMAGDVLDSIPEVIADLPLR